MFEGRPGNWTESKRIISDWQCDVMFEALSELSTQSKRRRTKRRTGAADDAGFENHGFFAAAPLPLPFVRQSIMKQPLRIDGTQLEQDDIALVSTPGP